MSVDISAAETSPKNGGNLVYLSKLNLDRQHPSVRQALRSCHDMHRSLMSAFPDDTTREQAGMLYQVNRDIIWMSSAIAPDRDTLEQKGFSVEGSRSIDSLQSVLQNGMYLGFHLLAVPTKKMPVEGKHSQRRYLRTEEERCEWLKRKGTQGGFRVCSARELGEETVGGIRQQQKLMFTAMKWEGVLEITDETIFWNSLCHGIGPERAYGAGLLRVYRL